MKSYLDGLIESMKVCDDQIKLYGPRMIDVPAALCELKLKLNQLIYENTPKASAPVVARPPVSVPFGDKNVIIPAPKPLKTSVYRLCEIVADIAYTMGNRHWSSNVDSRDDIARIVGLSHEFYDAYELTRNGSDDDYLNKVAAFAQYYIENTGSYCSCGGVRIHIQPYPVAMVTTTTTSDSTQETRSEQVYRERGLDVPSQVVE